MRMLANLASFFFDIRTEKKAIYNMYLVFVYARQVLSFVGESGNTYLTAQ